MSSITWGMWLQKWGMTSLKIKVPFLEMEWNPNDADKSAAWSLYVELLTRVTTQSLKVNEGNEYSALKSIHTIFNLTREILKANGPSCKEFTKIAIVVLNQVIRPFTTKWHPSFNNNVPISNVDCEQFRRELDTLQKTLITYTKMLADMADIEDLVELERID